MMKSVIYNAVFQSLHHKNLEAAYAVLERKEEETVIPMSSGKKVRRVRLAYSPLQNERLIRDTQIFVLF